MDDTEKKEQPDLQPWNPKKLPCINPSHNVPSLLYIPPGETYRHVCPGCQSEIVITSPMIYW